MRLPHAAKLALARHVTRVVERLDPARYRQEPAYVAALFARLDEVVYRGRNLTLEIRSTVVDDRAPNSAESVWGADFGIVAAIHTREEVLEKAVLGQAKRGHIPNLPPAEAANFRRQVSKMSRATHATVGLEVPTRTGIGPSVRMVEESHVFGDGWAVQSTGNNGKYEVALAPKVSGEPAVLVWPAMPLEEYIYSRMLKCLHGDRNEGLLKGLASSSLTALRIEARSPE
jgi:hypothetical protein